jgi:hypothetical protein
MKETTDQPGTSKGAEYPPPLPKAEPAEKRQRYELLERPVARSQAQTSFEQTIAQRLKRLQEACAGTHERNETAGDCLEVTLSEYRLARGDLMLVSTDRLHLMGRALMDSANLMTEIESIEKCKRELNGKSDLPRGSDSRENWLVDPQAQTIDVLDVESGRHVLVVRQAVATGVSSTPAGFERAANHPFPAAIALYFIVTVGEQGRVVHKSKGE